MKVSEVLQTLSAMPLDAQVILDTDFGTVQDVAMDVYLSTSILGGIEVCVIASYTPVAAV